MAQLPEEAIERATKQYAWSGRMSDALKAAYPAIERQVRAQVADEIRAERDEPRIKWSATFANGLTRAARIAEG